MENSNAKTTRNTIEFYLLFPAIKYVSFEIVRQSKHNTSDGKSKIKKIKLFCLTPLWLQKMNYKLVQATFFSLMRFKNVKMKRNI